MKLKCKLELFSRRDEPSIVHGSSSTWVFYSLIVHRSLIDTCALALFRRRKLLLDGSDVERTQSTSGTLDEGSFAIVKEVKWKGKSAALKLPRGNSEQDKARILHEVDMLQTFQHPNVVQFYGTLTIQVLPPIPSFRMRFNREGQNGHCDPARKHHTCSTDRRAANLSGSEHTALDGRTAQRIDLTPQAQLHFSW